MFYTIAQLLIQNIDLLFWLENQISFILSAIIIFVVLSVFLCPILSNRFYGCNHAQFKLHRQILYLVMCTICWYRHMSGRTSYVFLVCLSIQMWIICLLTTLNYRIFNWKELCICEYSSFENTFWLRHLN